METEHLKRIFHYSLTGRILTIQFQYLTNLATSQELI